MNTIKEIAPNQYHFIGNDGIERNLVFAHFSGKKAHKGLFDSYQCYKVDGLYGIAKDYNTIISDPVYSTLRCGNGPYFEYQIKEEDGGHREYIVCGRIKLNGEVYQNYKLHNPNYSVAGMDYTIKIPDWFAYICHIMGPYYLFKTKSFEYGVLMFDYGLRPQIVWEYADYTKHHLHNNFLFEPHKSQICLFNVNNDNDGIRSWSEVCVFAYSVETHKGKYIHETDKEWKELYIENWLVKNKMLFLTEPTNYKDRQKYNLYEDASDRDIWDAMTDGQMDYPDEGYDGDYEFTGR